MTWLNDWAIGLRTVDVVPQAAATKDRIDVVNTPAPTTTQEPSMRAVTPVTEEEEVQVSADDETHAIVKPDGKPQRANPSTVRIETPGTAISWFF